MQEAISPSNTSTARRHRRITRIPVLPWVIAVGIVMRCRNVKRKRREKLSVGPLSCEQVTGCSVKSGGAFWFIDDKFRVSAPVLELPKGGGAIKGIGEKFAVNPVT